MEGTELWSGCGNVVWYANRKTWPWEDNGGKYDRCNVKRWTKVNGRGGKTVCKLIFFINPITFNLNMYICTYCTTLYYTFLP